MLENYIPYPQVYMKRMLTIKLKQLLENLYGL